MLKLKLLPLIPSLDEFHSDIDLHPRPLLSSRFVANSWPHFLCQFFRRFPVLASFCVSNSREEEKSLAKVLIL